MLIYVNDVNGKSQVQQWKIHLSQGRGCPASPPRGARAHPRPPPGKKDPEFSVAAPARGHRAPWSSDVGGTVDLGEYMEYTIVYLSMGQYNMPLLLKFISEIKPSIFGNFGVASCQYRILTYTQFLTLANFFHKSALWGAHFPRLWSCGSWGQPTSDMVHIVCSASKWCLV